MPGAQNSESGLGPTECFSNRSPTADHGTLTPLNVTLQIKHNKKAVGTVRMRPTPECPPVEFPCPSALGLGIRLFDGVIYLPG
ncbi:hypothetical protein CC2G_000121 [Coprinopsis cinerea AmutBmut pab1-1]|nr:hypothetical protein CC2G_000121 [Coprinopsis cinerea AmutBmut pab1-1]